MSRIPHLQPLPIFPVYAKLGRNQSSALAVNPSSQSSLHIECSIIQLEDVVSLPPQSGTSALAETRVFFVIPLSEADLNLRKRGHHP